MQGLIGVLDHVSQLAGRGALLALLDFRIEAGVTADGFDEIEDVVGVLAGCWTFPDRLAVLVLVDLFPSAVQQEEDSDLCRGLHTDTGPAIAKRIAAVEFSGDRAGAESNGNLEDVRGLRTVLEVVATSRATDWDGTHHVQSSALPFEKIGVMPPFTEPFLRCGYWAF